MRILYSAWHDKASKYVTNAQTAWMAACGAMSNAPRVYNLYVMDFDKVERLIASGLTQHEAEAMLTKLFLTGRLCTYENIQFYTADDGSIRVDTSSWDE